MQHNIAELSKELYQNGVIQVKQLHSKAVIDEIKKAINENLKKPSAFSHEMKSENGTFFMDFNNWRRLNSIKNICQKDYVVKLILQLTKSSSCWLFHDHLLVKSGLAPATPWHHDRPYYVIKGDLNLSVWTPTADVSKKDGMVFLKGSHKSGNLYSPSSFRTGKNIELSEEFKVIDSEVLGSYDHISYDLIAGDALIFFNTTIHSANEHTSSFERQSLSVRYLVGEPRLTKKYINATPPFDKMGLSVVEGAEIPEHFFPRLA